MIVGANNEHPERHTLLASKYSRQLLSVKHARSRCCGELRLLSVFNKPHWIDAQVPFINQSQQVQSLFSAFRGPHELNQSVAKTSQKERREGEPATLADSAPAVMLIIIAIM